MRYSRLMNPPLLEGDYFIRDSMLQSSPLLEENLGDLGNEHISKSFYTKELAIAGGRTSLRRDSRLMSSPLLEVRV
jgi:hypothetical protein